MPKEIESILKDWEIYYVTRRPVDKEFLRERVALFYPLDGLLKRREKALELLRIDFNMLMKANGKVKYIDYEDDNVKIYYKKELTFENFVGMNPFSFASKIIKAIVEKKKQRSLLLSSCEDMVRKSFIENSKLFIFNELSSVKIEYSYESEWRKLKGMTQGKKLMEQEENGHFNCFWGILRNDILDEMDIFMLRFLPFFSGNSVVNKHIVDLISMYLDFTGKSVIRKRFSAHMVDLFLEFDRLDKERKENELKLGILNDLRMKKLKEKQEEARLIKLRKEEEAQAMKGFKAAELQPALLTLALDKQNIHTGAVNVQANEAMDSILKTVVSEGCGIVEVIFLRLRDVWYTSWATSTFFVSVHFDIKRHALDIFYINEKGDTVQELRYQRLLCCVVEKIERNNSETRQELYVRLWEECVDSLGMCFQGHMSRLCNVFSGFDPDLPLVASRGEQIQAAFQDLSTRTRNVFFFQKKEEAFKIFEKFSIEDEETKKAWLEVLNTDSEIWEDSESEAEADEEEEEGLAHARLAARLAALQAEAEGEAEDAEAEGAEEEEEAEDADGW